MSLFISTLVLLLVAFSLGIVVGLLMKGIHVHQHTHTETTKNTQTEYNPSSAKNLPPKLQEYAQKNQGFIDFD